MLCYISRSDSNTSSDSDVPPAEDLLNSTVISAPTPPPRPSIASSTVPVPAENGDLKPNLPPRPLLQQQVKYLVKKVYSKYQKLLIYL